jgi:methyl-accepting chemotaxis protein
MWRAIVRGEGRVRRKHKSIAAKLVGVMALLFLPLLIMGYLLASEMMHTVRFAQREVLGVQYLVPLYRLNQQLVRVQLGQVEQLGDATWAADLAALDALEHDDTTALLEETWSTVATQLQNINASAEPEQLRTAIKVLRAVVVRVGDASNLILDPDLDTYYVMDVVLLKVFALLDSVVTLHNTDAKAEPQLRDVYAAQAKDVVTALQAGINTAVANTADEGELDALVAKAKALQQTEVNLPALTALFDEAASVLTHLLEQRIAKQQRKLLGLLAVVLLSALVACTLAAWLLRRVVVRLNEAVRVSKEVSSGDLTVSTRHIGGGGDETSELMSALLAMVETLHTTILQARVTAEDLSEASEQLSAVSVQAAGTSHTISRSAEGMTGAVEHLAQRIEAIVYHVKEAQVMSKKSMGLCESGSDVIKSITGEMREVAAAVDNASTAIRDLEQQSNKISSIVSVIKDIADQTNLLALNAAIEAARAGEQGRGFSVVADEVRQLAARTSQSTQEITHMIGKIQEGTRSAVSTMEAVVHRVDQGSSNAIHAGEAISEIRAVVAHVTGVVSDITADVDEQSAASAAIQLEIDRIARQSKDNAIAVEETAATARRLADHAIDLKEWVQMFKIKA